MKQSKPVLLVEDNDEIREAAIALLETEGFAVVAAQNGAQALSLLRGGLDPALILLDLFMPVMDGWQFREEQLRDERFATIPTVLCSAARDVHAAAAAMRAKAAFQKGSDDIGRMLRVVGSICGGE